jgi:hypothetical protein
VTFPQIKKTVNMRHNVRMGLTEERKRSVQYAMDKRREERGTQVIHVHEKPAKAKLWPSTEEMQARILAYYQGTGALPQVMQVPFQTDAPSMAYAVTGLPEDPAWTLQDGRRLVEMKVEISDALGLR